MTSNIKNFPHWKPEASAEERFYELSMEAREKPNNFGKILVIWSEDKEDGSASRIRYVSNCPTIREELGLLDEARMEMHMYQRGWK